MQNFNEYIKGDDFLSGTDFSEFPTGVLCGKGLTYTHKKPEGQIFLTHAKQSTIKILSESGNHFVRIERSADNNTNDPYFDFYDTQKNIYTGDMVVEVSFRLGDYSTNTGSLNLIQFINRDNGNIFQSLLTMSTDGSILYRNYNKSDNTDRNVDTGYDMVKGEWTHICVVLHRNAVDPDTFDVYINGEEVKKGIVTKNPLNSLHQLRISQFSGGATAAGTMDLDNVWLYKGSAPNLVVGSGADEDSLVGRLDYSDPAISVGTVLTGKVKTDKFEINAQNELFTVRKDTWRNLIQMDQTNSSPYVDVFANGARGALVADMGLILSPDWSGNLELLSPYATEGDYTSRECFMTVNEDKELLDREGRVLASLGEGINRIALSIGGDRKFVSVFLNGKLLGNYETKYGSGYGAIDGVRILEYRNSANSGNMYLYYADIYRGLSPAISSGNTELRYYNNFDTAGTPSTVAPVTMNGSVTTVSHNGGIALGYAANVSSGSSLKYAASLPTDGITTSFVFKANGAKSLGLLSLGSWSVLSLDAAGKFTVKGTETTTLFAPERGATYSITVAVNDGVFTVYIDGIPFVYRQSVPSGLASTVDHAAFLSAAASGSYSAYIDDLEIYVGGEPHVNALGVPMSFTASAKDFKAHLSWEALDCADGYRIYRSDTATGAGEALGGLITECEYTDGTVLSGAEYYYRVVPVFKRGGAEYSLPKAGEPVCFEIKDPGLNVQVQGIKNAVGLYWDEFHADNRGYIVYRSDEQNGEYKAISETITDTEYVDREAFPGLILYYKVCVVITRNGEPFVFGLEQEGKEGIAGTADPDTPDGPDNPDTPDNPDNPNNPDSPGGGQDDTPMSPEDGGVDIPSSGAEVIVDTDFDDNLAELGFTLNGSIKTDSFSDQIRGKVLGLTLTGAETEPSFAAVAQGPVATKSLVIDFELYVSDVSGSVGVLTAASENGVLFDILTLTSGSGDEAILSLGAAVGGENKTLSVLKKGEWRRITAWINVSGDKLAVYLDGSCLDSAVALPIGEDGPVVSSMTELRLLNSGVSGSRTVPLAGETVAVNIDNFSIRSADTFANAYSSAVIAPKVSVSEKENAITWKAANGALYYTVWRAGEDGIYEIVADNLKNTSYTDSMEADCSYKVTYTFNTLGIKLDSLFTSSGVNAKKSAAEVIGDTVKALIDLSNPGTVGILALFILSMVSVVGLAIIRRYVLKVDDIQPIRKREENSDVRK